MKQMCAGDRSIVSIQLSISVSPSPKMVGLQPTYQLKPKELEAMCDELTRDHKKVCSCTPLKPERDHLRDFPSKSPEKSVKIWTAPNLKKPGRATSPRSLPQPAHLSSPIPPLGRHPSSLFTADPFSYPQGT